MLCEIPNHNPTNAIHTILTMTTIASYGNSQVVFIDPQAWKKHTLSAHIKSLIDPKLQGVQKKHRRTSGTKLMDNTIVFEKMLVQSKELRHETIKHKSKGKNSKRPTSSYPRGYARPPPVGQ